MKAMSQEEREFEALKKELENLKKSNRELFEHVDKLAQLVRDHSNCEICSGELKALKAGLGDLIFVTSLSEPVEEEKKVVSKKISKKKVKV